MQKQAVAIGLNKFKEKRKELLKQEPYNPLAGLSEQEIQDIGDRYLASMPASETLQKEKTEEGAADYNPLAGLSEQEIQDIGDRYLAEQAEMSYGDRALQFGRGIVKGVTETVDLASNALKYAVDNPDNSLDSGITNEAYLNTIKDTDLSITDPVLKKYDETLAGKDLTPKDATGEGLQYAGNFIAPLLTGVSSLGGLVNVAKTATALGAAKTVQESLGRIYEKDSVLGLVEDVLVDVAALNYKKIYSVGKKFAEKTTNATANIIKGVSGGTINDQEAKALAGTAKIIGALYDPTGTTALLAAFYVASGANVAKNKALATAKFAINKVRRTQQEAKTLKEALIKDGQERAANYAASKAKESDAIQSIIIKRPVGDLATRANLNTNHVPNTHFSIMSKLQESIVKPLEEIGVNIPAGVFPDISQGILFNSELKNKYPLIRKDSVKIKYDRGTGSQTELSIMAYPKEAESIYEEFHKDWLQNRALKYFKRKLGKKHVVTEKVQELIKNGSL